MSQEYKPRVNLKLTQLTHRLLKVWCAERDLTLQAGATRLIEEGVKRKVGAAAAAGMVERAPGVWEWPGAPTIDTSGLSPRPAPSPPVSQPKPEREPFPWATREDARNGTVMVESFRIPLDWTCWDGDVVRTRAEMIAAGLANDLVPYEPPPSNGESNGASVSTSIRYTPATHDIPRDWVNEYGLTVEQQSVVGADDTLEYGPRKGGVAH